MFIALVLLVDVLAGTHAVLVGFLALAPLIAAAVDTHRRTAAAAALATAAALAAGLPSGRLGSLDHFLRVAVVATVSGVAVYVAYARTEQERRLRRMREVVRVTQSAILREMPLQVAEIELAARYVAAHDMADVGGDLFEAVAEDGRVRIIVGDVCGKGLSAVRLAAAVMGAFRQSAIIRHTLPEVARDLDALVAREPVPACGVPFVTAVLVELDSREIKVVNCGHPAPILWRRRHGFAEISVRAPERPLGLAGTHSSAVVHTWEPGDRLLLHTDGLTEARDRGGRFLPMREVHRCLTHPSMRQSVDAIWTAFQRHVGNGPQDDVALVVAECPPRATEGTGCGAPQSPAPGRSGAAAWPGGKPGRSSSAIGS